MGHRFKSQQHPILIAPVPQYAQVFSLINNPYIMSSNKDEYFRYNKKVVAMLQLMTSGSGLYL